MDRDAGKNTLAKVAAVALVQETEVVASASNPAYFGVAAPKRPLCAHPKAATYKGSGDINAASNFICQ